MSLIRIRPFVAMLLLFLAVSAEASETVRPTRNLIIMIADGTSWATISAARWLQWIKDPSQPRLAIDSHLCGSVRTTSSNAPIGDSAPTTSTYLTGYLSQSGFISTYPPADPKNDILPIDPSKAYQPLTTLLEAARLTQSKSTGIIATCEFPHATPADCAAHTYNRNKYEWIAPQMVHNSLDLVISGGHQFLSSKDSTFLRQSGYGVYYDNLDGLRNAPEDRVWALFGEKEMSYDIDRDTLNQPSLSESTSIALNRLSQNPNGFVLMVEGSQIDWAAHINDPLGMITEFLAFDKAVATAIEFAQKDQSTTVIILSDHGNSGISIGIDRCKGYDRLTYSTLFDPLCKMSRSVPFVAKSIQTSPKEASNIIRRFWDIEITDHEKTMISESIQSQDFSRKMADLLTSRTCFGFTSHGHTGEEVFLAAYHPKGDRPIGHFSNIQINQYLQSVMGLTVTLDELTDRDYVPHKRLLYNIDYSIIPDKVAKALPTLQIRTKENTYILYPNTNLVRKQGRKKKTEEIRLETLILYVDKNEMFYLPQSLLTIISKMN